MADQKYMTKVGALWTRVSKDGKTQYMSGMLQTGIFGDIKIVCFLNGKKEKDNQPDLIVYLQEPKNGADKPAGRSSATMPGASPEGRDDAGFAAHAEIGGHVEDNEIDITRIPF